MIAHVLALLSVQVGIGLVLHGLGMYPAEDFSKEWWLYNIGIALVVTPVWMAFVTLLDRGGRNGK